MLTFIYTTCRKNPKLEWFVDSLYKQVLECKFDTEKIQLVIVDFELQYDNTRQDNVTQLINNRFDFVHAPSKPSPWQGKYRLTSRDCFSASLARNTGICYAKHSYIVFIDDLSVIGPNSFKHIVEYAVQNKVVAFSYKKVWDMDVKDGEIINKRETVGGTDSRWSQGEEFRQIGGSQLFGYSASPLSVLLSVNGYDEICNSIGGEDYHYGMRIEKLSIPIYYSRHVVFYESEDHADQGNVFLRRDPLISEEFYKLLMEKYKITNRWVQTARTDVSHLVLDMLTRNKSWTEGNDYVLSELRNKIQSGGSFDCLFDVNMKTIDGIFLRDI